MATSTPIPDPLDGREACPNCSGEAEPVFPGQSWGIQGNPRQFKYVRCTRCGLLWADPLPTPAEIERYYRTDFDFTKYADRMVLKRIQGKRRWRRLRSRLEHKLPGRNSLLDVGCGHGWFVAAARKDGWNAAGIDLPSSAIDFARRHLLLPVIESDFNTTILPPGSRDVVTLWHSLEHMLEPGKTLSRVREVLAPGGLLLIAVPNADSLGLARAGSGWIWLQQPFVHPWHFSLRTLESYLTRVGFEVVSWKTEDTWDACFLYDALIFPKLDRPVFRRVSRMAGRLLSKLGADRTGVESRSYFLMDESARLVAYAVQLAFRSVRPAAADRGSELRVLARRMP